MKPIIIVSADGHAGGRLEDYKDYLEANSPGTYERLVVEDARYLAATKKMLTLSDELYSIVDEGRRLRDGGVEAVFDAKTRLAELERDGVVAEVMFPGHQAATTPGFTGANEVYSAEERAVGARAYNRWLADFVADGEGRLVGVADTGSSRNMDDVVKEVRWAAKNGLTVMTVPNDIADPELPPLHHERYEPFWKACADTGQVMSIHAGWAGKQGVIIPMFEWMAENGGFNMGGAEAIFPGIEPRRAIWQILLAGVFDRYPSLKLVLTEVRADWVPQTLAHLDARFEREETPLKMKPSEYWARHCYVAPSGIRPTEVGLRNQIGVRNLIFGSDYPHYEGSWPNNTDWIRDAFRGVSEDDARQILGLNAIELYGFDKAKLEAVAARIGPKPSDLLGDFEVDPRKIAHFHTRSGYSFPIEKVDTKMIDDALDEDLALKTLAYA